jgi:hypothetical protein
VSTAILFSPTAKQHVAIPPQRQQRRPQGRATLEMKVRIRDTPEGPQNPTLTIVLDGYNAPVSAGQVRAICAHFRWLCCCLL